MGRTAALAIGFGGGVLLAGLGVGILVPVLPHAWRSEGLVWGVGATLVALCLGIAYLASRPRRE